VTPLLLLGKKSLPQSANKSKNIAEAGSGL
jgi:hypothetical protein